VANALVTYESDLYGTLKPIGALAPTDKTPPPPRPAEPIPTGSDHPIIATVIGTPQDAQLSAAVTYLKAHPRGSASR
jgi:hypothetical protein